MGTGAGGIIDIMFLASGIYLIYTAVAAKKKGKVAANVMLGKNMSEKDIKDKIGFIEYMYKKIIVAGAMIVIASVIHIVNDYVIGSAALTWIGIMMILTAIILYTATYLRGQKRFLQGRQKENKKGKK